MNVTPIVWPICETNDFKPKKKTKQKRNVWLDVK